MPDAFLSFLKDTSNQQVLTWLGGGLVVVIGGLWTVVKFFAKKGGSGEAASSVRVGRGGVAAGRDISNSTINTNSDKEFSKNDHKTKP